MIFPVVGTLELQLIAGGASALFAVVSSVLIMPWFKRTIRLLRTKDELNRSYCNIRDLLEQDRASWSETITSWKGTAEALRAEMTVLRERVARVESELAILVPKYQAALHFIRDLRSHIVQKDMPDTPILLAQDLQQIT